MLRGGARERVRVHSRTYVRAHDAYSFTPRMNTPGRRAIVDRAPENRSLQRREC